MTDSDSKPCLQLRATCVIPIKGENLKKGPVCADISMVMPKRRHKKKMLETTFISKSSAYKPAFNFFKSCQTSARPDWGCHIFGFKIPSGPKNSPAGK